MKAAAVLQQFALTAPRHIRRRPLRFLLSLLTIIVAVTLFVSMRITQAGLLATFRANLEALSGGADAIVLGPGKVPTAVLAQLEAISGVEAAPLVLGTVLLADSRDPVRVFGIDPLRDARVRGYAAADSVQLDLASLLRRDAAVVPESIARQRGWSPGKDVSVIGPAGTRTIRVAGLLKDRGAAAAFGGNVLFLTTDAAWRLLDRPGAYDQIDLKLLPPATLDRVAAALGPAYSIRPSRERNPTFEFMYGQFQLVLVGVSVLAGLIGAFVVYNAVSLSVVERAKEIGTLRALGARRGEILLAFTLEAALLGAAASLLGCLAGQFVAERAMSQAATSLSMFLNLGPLRHVVPGDIWLLGPLVGVVTTLFGAFIPARAAALQPPVATLKLGELRQAGPRRTLLWFVSSALLLSVAAWLIHRRESSWTAHVGAVALGYLALALVGPALIHWGLRPIARLAGRLMPLPAWLAIDNIVQFPTRTSLTSITLGGTLALVIALSGWVVSVQADLDRWMDDVFVFDLSMQLNDLSATPYPRGTIAAGVLDAVRRDPRCAAAYGVRAVFVPFHGREVMLLAIESQALLDGRIARGRSRDVEADRRAAAAMQHGAIGVSTNFATLYGVRAGDRVTIPTPKGNQEFTVAEVRTDYSWMHGVVTLDLGTFRSLWEDDGLSYVDIRVTPGEDVEAFRTDLSQRLAAPLGAYVHRADEIQSAARRLMREWFRLADVQLLLALIIGGAGVANTLLISVLTQSRQIALLRAIGAQAAQIRRTLMAEAAGLGLIGALAGWGLGLATIHFALAPISAHTSGYVFPLVTPWATLAKTTAAALAIALGAALLPLRAVRRLDLVAAIGYE